MFAIWLQKKKQSMHQNSSVHHGAEGTGKSATMLMWMWPKGSGVKDWFWSKLADPYPGNIYIILLYPMSGEKRDIKSNVETRHCVCIASICKRSWHSRYHCCRDPHFRSITCTRRKLVSAMERIRFQTVFATAVGRDMRVARTDGGPRGQCLEGGRSTSISG